MYIRNKRGSSTVPCGTPEVTGEEGVFYRLTPLSGTFQPGNSGSKQVSCSGWATLSNDLLKSSRMASICCLLSNQLARSWTVGMRFTRPSLPEPMLLVTEDVMTVRLV